MLKTLIHYQMYIIIGILVFPILSFIIYFTKKMIDRARFVRALDTMKKPLMERINNIESIYEMKEQQAEMNMIINDIKGSINELKQEIQLSQETLELEKINQIENDISIFYENMQNKQQGNASTTEPVIVKETPQQIYQQAIIQQQTYQLQAKQEQNTLHKEQIRVMNENISKFLVVYREKDKIIDEKNKAINEKNKSIYVLQQKLLDAEQRVKKLIAQHQGDGNKDKIIEEKAKTIATLQQRLQDVENKFKKVALLHKSIAEKEEIKDRIIDEKNAFIISLQNKLTEIESKLQTMMNINEENKDKFLNRKFLDIDQKIKMEKRKNRIFITLFIFFLMLGIVGFLFVYDYYIQNIAAYTM